MNRIAAVPLAALAGLALLAACAEPPKPTTVALKVDATPEMNGGAPAKVKVYYLNSPANFSSLDFFALYDKPQAALGQDLIAVDEYLLTPGQSVEAAKSFDMPVNHIGAVVGLRDVDRPGWRAVGELSPRAPNAVVLTVDGQGAKFGGPGG